MIFCPNIGDYCNDYKLTGKKLICNCVHLKKCNHELEEIRTYRNGEVISINHQCSICGFIKEGE